jgi:DNA-binding transcriptional LysR family regulator
MSPRLDSRSLALFLAVADAASIRQAAERLHLSQPPLSRAIRELESRLGCHLFERHAGGVTLTAAGRALRPYALKVERLLSEAEKTMAGQAAPMRIRLGFTSALEPAWFNKLTELAGACFKEQGLDVVSDTSPRLVRLLRGGRLDAACIALPTETGELQVHEVDRLPMVVALASTHALARRRRLHLIDLAATPMFWFERARQPAFYDHCERVFARQGLTARRLGEPSDHHVLLGAVAAGRGVALLPASFAALRRAGVCYRQLVEGDELAVGIGLATPSDRPMLNQRLAELVQQARVLAPV